jgi:magnesium transporter
MIRILFRHRSGTVIETLTLEQVSGALQDPQARLWIDLVNASADEQRRVLDGIFHFHPLAIEDAINEVHVPKVDDYGSYLYLVLHTFKLGDERMDIDTYELDIFLGANYLITLHEHSSRAIDMLWQAEYHRTRGLARGPAFLLYELLDRQLDSFIPLLDDFETRVEGLGDTIFTNGSRSEERQFLNDILTAKSTALRVRRILTPQYRVMVELAEKDFSVIPNEARLYFQDLADHIVRLSDLAESMRELVTGTMSIHLTLTSNRLNEVMKVLTVISTIFMPLSFFAGVYGMNFEHMPELGWRWSYPVILLFFTSLAGGMLYLFRRRRWL